MIRDVNKATNLNPTGKRLWTSKEGWQSSMIPVKDNGRISSEQLVPWVGESRLSRQKVNSANIRINLNYCVQESKTARRMHWAHHNSTSARYLADLELALIALLGKPEEPKGFLPTYGVSSLDGLQIPIFEHTLPRDKVMSVVNSTV